MRLLILGLFTGLLLQGLAAQAPPLPPLTDYVGTYADKSGQNVEIVAGDELFAVQNDAKYKLKSSARDEFTTVYGEKIPFRRDASGKITGYSQQGEFHPRISLSIAPESAALARPRPEGQNSPDAYHYQPPADLHDGIPVGDIVQSDLGTATANTIMRAILDGTYKDVHSVLLFQRGHLVLEEYFYGYSAARPHQLRSATKSVVSTLAGIAIDRGAIPGVNEPVLPHMSYASYANPDPRKSAMTLANFLSMSSGLACNDHSSDSPGREMVIDDMPDWVKATLDLPMINDPGTKAFYCSGGVAVVGRTVESAVHMPLPDFAQANLFGPLGIARADWKWNYDLTNADKEYSQIHLRPRDMLKLGMLFANNGRWQDRQVISSSYVQASLAVQSHVDNTGYGYFWWHPYLNVDTPEGTQQVFVNAAQGNGGQKIYLVPQYDLVAVFTAGDYNSPEGAPPNRIMAQIILPALIRANAKPAAAKPPSYPPPPTRDPNTPGYVKATALPDGANAPANADGNFILGPTHNPAPEVSAKTDIPQGAISTFTMNSADSKFYPGIARDPGILGTQDPADPTKLIVTTSHPAPYMRRVTVYVPKQYVPGTVAPLIVGADGPDPTLFSALDGLIAEHKLPVMIAISISNGSGDAQGSERGLEYDTMSGRYAEWVEQEVLPQVESQAHVKLTKDPDARATMGGSSGGSCALIMAWYHPELYHRVLTYSGTYINQQWPHNDDSPHGAWEFHEHLIPNSPAKPLRIWMEVGDKDLFNPNVMRDGMHDWVLANENMARVLAAKGYHYQFVFARNAGHVDHSVKQQTLPEALEYVWQGYKAKN